MPFRKTKPKDGQFLVGRDDQLRFFRDAILKPEDPEHNILSISGQGGVGKSTLLRRFIDELHLPEYHEYCLSALVNERQTTPASVMERFADQLREQGHPLKKFDDALTRYKEAVLRIQMNYRDEQEVLVRDVVDVVGSAVEDIPFAGNIVHKGATAFTDIMIERGRMRQFLKDAARLEDPIADLTGAFVRDLNQLADTLVPISGTWNKRSRRIILCFDTFEQLASDIAPWLLDHFLEQDVSSNIVLVIAGRDSIESSIPDDPKRWLPLLDSGAIHLLSLNVFTEEETRIYLEKRGITGVEQMQQIRQLSRGLPLYLSMLTTNPEGHIDPTAGVVENFLRWIPKQEVQKRELALNAALFSLPFTKDDIAAFVYVEPERTDLYQWLIGQPFVQYSSQDGRYIYHDIARDLFRRHLYQRSQEDYYATRKKLAHYYKKRLEVLQIESDKSLYKSRSWQELVLALIQQVFLLPDEESLLLGIEYVLRMHEYNWQNNELIKILNSFLSSEPGHQVTAHVQFIVKQLLQSIELNPANHYQQWVVATDILLEKVLRIPTFPSDVIAYLYHYKGRACRFAKDYQNALLYFIRALTLLPDYAKIYRERGETYRQMERYEEALADLDRATDLDENYVWALALRGETYSHMKRYEEALTNFDRALALDKKHRWALTARGQTYGHMKRYEEALTDFDRALALDENYKWAIVVRGQTYRMMGRYEEALTDFDKAIALDENYTSAFALRGETYRQMRRYEEALTDFDKAIALDENYTSAFASRGQTYGQMARYEEALVDLDKALVLDEKYKWAFVWRGETYRQMERYEEALTDFDKAIALDENDAWTLASRGQTYRRMKRYEEALVDLDKALVLDEKYKWAFVWRGETYRQMERYEEALTDFDKAIALDENYIRALFLRGETYRQMRRYEEALTDFDKAIALDEKYKRAFVLRGETYRMMGRYEEAVADLDRAIALDEKYEWALVSRGKIYRQLKRYKEALIDFERGIALDESEDWSWYNKALVYLLTNQQPLFHDTIRAALDIARSQITHLTIQDKEYYRFSFNAALYLLVDGSTVEAEATYRVLLSECSFIPLLQDAATDLEEFLTIQPANEFVQDMLALVKQRIEEIKP